MRLRLSNHELIINTRGSWRSQHKQMGCRACGCHWHLLREACRQFWAPSGHGARSGSWSLGGTFAPAVSWTNVIDIDIDYQSLKKLLQTEIKMNQKIRQKLVQDNAVYFCNFDCTITHWLHVRHVTEVALVVVTMNFFGVYYFFFKNPHKDSGRNPR